VEWKRAAGERIAENCRKEYECTQWETKVVKRIIRRRGVIVTDSFCELQLPSDATAVSLWMMCHEVGFNG